MRGGIRRDPAGTALAGAAALAYGWVAFTRLFPADLDSDGPLHVRLAYAAFLGRTFEHHLALAAIPVAGLLAWRGRRRVAVAVVPLAALALPPALDHVAPGGGEAVAGPELRLTSANVYLGASNGDALLREIDRADPDVLLLQEYTDDWHARLAAPLRERFAHAFARPLPRAAGSAIYSRLPLEDEAALGLAHQRAVVRHAGRPVAIYNLHPYPPSTLARFRAQRAFLAELLVRLRAERMPYVVGGDLNFTDDSPHGAKLEELGARDALDVACRGRCATWPVGRGAPLSLPPLRLRLDHLYVSEELAVSEARTGDPGGSDHRPVHASIGFAAR